MITLDKVKKAHNEAMEIWKTEVYPTRKKYNKAEIEARKLFAQYLIDGKILAGEWKLKMTYDQFYRGHRDILLLVFEKNYFELPYDCRAMFNALSKEDNKFGTHIDIGKAVGLSYGKLILKINKVINLELYNENDISFIKTLGIEVKDIEGVIYNLHRIQETRKQLLKILQTQMSELDYKKFIKKIIDE